MREEFSVVLNVEGCFGSLVALIIVIIVFNIHLLLL